MTALLRFALAAAAILALFALTGAPARGQHVSCDPGAHPPRGAHGDSPRYFVVFAARNGTLRAAGPAFAMLIRIDDPASTIDSFGLYLAQDERILGPIPAGLRSRFLSEPRVATETMLRLELSASEFERAAALIADWQRRVRQRALRYELAELNTIVFLDELARALNRCGTRLKLHELTWRVDDKVTAKRSLSQVPFHFIRELRELNGRLHLTDEQFRTRSGQACIANCISPVNLLRHE